MYTRDFLICTKKNNFFNIKNKSYKLMLKSGMICQSSLGIYIWLPLGIKILNKIKFIIKKEMNSIKANEISIPILQNVDIWKITNRYNEYGNELFSLYDRNNNKFLLSPTNEEIVNKLINSKIKSCKQLPLIIYQIKTKFRDEIRPSFGVIKSREFLMKDAYSFHIKKKCLKNTYYLILKSYVNIFKIIDLNFYIKKTISNIIGGKITHEFLFYKKKSEINKDYFIKTKNIILKNLNLISLSNKNLFKIFIFKTLNKYKLVIISENHELNVSKIRKINKFFYFIKNIFFKNILNNFEFFNINNLKLDVLLDYNIAVLNNIKNKKIKILDLIKINKKIKIELAHIFQIGDKYSRLMNTFIFNKNKKIFYKMASYGIGIDRLIASLIEQNFNNKLKLPNSLVPFKIFILPINLNKFIEVQKISNFLYNTFIKKKIDILFENRNKYIGDIFKDIELLCIPNVIVVNINNLKKNYIEYKNNFYKKKIKIYNIIKLFNV